MSAAEKLRALDGVMTPGPWQAFGRRLVEMRHRSSIAQSSDYYAAEDDTPSVAALRNALPQIVAVVQAAEECNLDHQAGTTERLDHRLLIAALAALDEALSPPTGGSP